MKLAIGLAVAVGAIIIAPAERLDAQQPSFTTVGDSIRSYIGRGLIPSAAVAVAKDGRIVFEAGFGLADRERNVAADARTMYSLASISKPFTATAIMQLVEEGKIDLDQPINRYLGKAKLTGIADDANQATVRRVMSHTAGLPLHYEFFYENEDHRERTMDDAIARYGILINRPGTAFEYSNLGYGILDETVKRVSGIDYPTYMRQRIFAPLGLERTAVHLPAELRQFAAERYFPNGQKIPYYDFDHDGGSAVYSSAHDLVRFGMFHIGNAVGEQRPILRPETRKAMQQVVTLPNAPNNYALGWSVANPFGVRRVAHTGGMPGVSTVLHLYPDHNVVVVVLTNQSNGVVGRIADDLAAAALPIFADSLAKARARGPATPPAQPAVSNALLGTWEGILRTYEREVPMRLVVDLNRVATIAIGDQAPVQLTPLMLSPDGLRLQGRAATTIPTEDARRHPHVVQLNLHLRDGVLLGQASAIGADGTTAYFALTSFVRLSRKPVP